MARRRDFDTKEMMLPNLDGEPSEPATGIHDVAHMLSQLELQRADRWTLTVVNGARAGFVTEIAEGNTVFGRGAQSHVVIDEDGLSRRHACFVRQGRALSVRDLGSTNGTFVGSDRVEGDWPLADGDTVRLASTLMRVQLRTAAELEAMKSLYESSVRDPLTKLFNRRHLDERLQTELAYAIRHRTTLSVMLLDLDHFKHINDTHGHLAGDEVLRRTARFLADSVRQEDLVARYGGEEMVVVLRGVGAQGAEIFASRVRGGIEALQIVFEGTTIPVTASIGVATWSPTRPYASVEGLVAAADDCLYRAKDAGRNLVICDASPRSSPPV